MCGINHPRRLHKDIKTDLLQIIMVEAVCVHIHSWRAAELAAVFQLMPEQQKDEKS